MKEYIQSALLTGALTFSPSIGYDHLSQESFPQTPPSHISQVESTETNNSLELDLDSLSTELKLAITLFGIGIVAGKFASTRRFTMHSEREQDIGAWASFAAIAGGTALVLLDTWL